MSADQVAALEQVVVARANDNLHPNQGVTAAVQGNSDGTGPRSKDKRLWQKRRRADDHPQLQAAKHQQFLAGSKLPAAKFSLHNDTSDHEIEGRSQKAGLKDPNSSKAKSSKGKKSKKLKDNVSSDDREEFRLDGLDDDGDTPKKKFYRRRVFWTFYVPLIWTVIFGFIGVMLRVFSPYKTAHHVQLWRFFFFAAFLPPIYVVSNNILLAVVWFFETQFFTTTNVLYFVIALKSPARYVVMSLLLLPLYIPLFASQADLSAGAHTAYDRVLSVIACLIVFNGMNFLKVLFAKMMSALFHTSTHFTKMQEALDKEYYLKVLATPRQDGSSFVDMLQADESNERLDTRNSGLGNTAPGRFVSKMVTPLRKVPLVGTRRASSLPTPASLDRLTEQRAAELEAQKQELPERRPAAIKTARPSAVSASTEPTPNCPSELKPQDSQHTFQPPNPVPPSPQGQPPPPSPAAYLSKSSMPLAGTMATSTVRSHPVPTRAVPLVHFPQSLALAPDQTQGSRGGRPHNKLERRNSDGGAGMAGILQDLELRTRVAEQSAPHTLQSRLTHLKSTGNVTSPRGSQASQDGEEPDVTSRRNGRQTYARSAWARRQRFHRTPSAIQEEREPNSPDRLPATGEQMTNEEGVALVATIHQVEKHLRKRQMMVPFVDQLKSSGTTSELEARKLAFFIFWNVKPFFDRNYIVQSDLEAFLSPRRSAEAFSLLDRDADMKLTLAELRSSIEEILNERANLSMQLRDTKSVVGKLELVIGFALHIIALFFYLMIFGVNIQHVWVLFTSIFIGFAFIFGSSLKNLFEAVLFLFIQHPFDIGDILILDNNDRVKVEEISLSVIVMLRGDGMRMWVPTTQLVPKTCQNITRSENRGDAFKFMVDVGVISVEAMQQIDQAVGKFIESRETDFAVGHSVQLAACGDPLKVALNIGFEFSHNGVDIGKMSQARSDLLQVVSDKLGQLGISSTQAPVKVYSSS